jgi:hypothetical protein
MTYVVTIKDLEVRGDSTYYTGPLDEAKDFIRSLYSVTESSYTDKEGEKRFSVYLGLDGEEVGWKNCNDFGNGDTMDEAWRYALGAEFGPADGEFSAFPLSTNKTLAVRALADHHFPADKRFDVFYSTTTEHIIVMDKDGDLWQVYPDGGLKVYRS